MGWLQRVLALPMLGTCVWLGWVLFRQAGAQGVGLLLLGAAFLAVAL
jgi:thiol:disulfide interchange protein DsbD